MRIIFSGLVVLSLLSKNFLESNRVLVYLNVVTEGSLLNGNCPHDWVMPWLNFAMTSHVVVIQACSHDLWSRG